MEAANTDVWPGNVLSEEELGQHAAAVAAYPDLRGDVFGEGIPEIPEGQPDEYIEAQAQRLREFQSTIAAVGANTLLRLYSSSHPEDPARPVRTPGVPAGYTLTQVRNLVRETTQLRDFQRALCLSNQRGRNMGKMYATVLYLKSNERDKWYGGAPIIFGTEMGAPTIVSQGLPQETQIILHNEEERLLGNDFIPGGNPALPLLIDKHGSWPPSPYKPNNSLPDPNYPFERGTTCRPRVVLQLPLPILPGDPEPVDPNARYNNSPHITMPNTSRLDDLAPRFGYYAAEQPFTAGMEIKQGRRSLGSLFADLRGPHQQWPMDVPVTTRPVPSNPLSGGQKMYATFTILRGLPNNFGWEVRRVIGVLTDQTEDDARDYERAVGETAIWPESRVALELEEAINGLTQSLQRPGRGGPTVTGDVLLFQDFEYDVAPVPPWEMKGTIKLVGNHAVDNQPRVLAINVTEGNLQHPDGPAGAHPAFGPRLVTVVSPPGDLGDHITPRPRTVATPEWDIDDEAFVRNYTEQRIRAGSFVRPEWFRPWTSFTRGELNQNEPQRDPMTLQDWAIVEILRVRGFYDPIPEDEDDGTMALYENEAALRAAQQGAGAIFAPRSADMTISPEWVWVKVLNVDLCVDQPNPDQWNWGLTDEIVKSRLHRYPNLTTDLPADRMMGIDEFDPNCERRQRITFDRGRPVVGKSPLLQGGNWIPPTQKTTEVNTIWCIPFYFLCCFADTMWNTDGALALREAQFTMTALQPAEAAGAFGDVGGRVRRRLEEVENGVCTNLEGKDLCDLYDPTVNFCIQNAINLVCPCDYPGSGQCSELCSELINNYWNGRCRCNVENWLQLVPDTEVSQKVRSDYTKLENLLESCGARAEGCTPPTPPPSSDETNVNRCVDELQNKNCVAAPAGNVFECADCYAENRVELEKNYGCSNNIAIPYCAGLDPKRTCSSVSCPQGQTRVSDPNQRLDYETSGVAYGCCVESCQDYECPAGSFLRVNAWNIPIEDNNGDSTCCTTSTCEDLHSGACVVKEGCRFINDTRECKSECPVTAEDLGGGGVQFKDDEIQGYFPAAGNDCNNMKIGYVWDEHDRANCNRAIEKHSGTMYHCRYEGGGYDSCERGDIVRDGELDLVYMYKTPSSPGERWRCNDPNVYSVDKCSDITGDDVEARCNWSWEGGTGERCHKINNVFFDDECVKYSDSDLDDLEDEYANKRYACTYEPRSC